MGERIRNLAPLSSFSTKVLKFCLASLILKNGNLLHIKTVNINGTITDATIITIDAILAILRALVIGMGSYCVNFITEKNVRS